MNNYTVTVRSSDAINTGDIPGNYEVAFPWMPPGQYRATVNYLVTSGNTAPYALQIRCPEIVRALTTQAISDGWCTCTIMTGNANTPGVVYFSKPPTRMNVRLLTQSTLAIVTGSAHTQFTMHFERIDI